MFDLGKLSRSLEELYRQIRADYVSGTLPQARPVNLNAYFDIGVAQDHEVREIGALTDWVVFYRAQVAPRHYHHPMEANGRLRPGEEKFESTLRALVKVRAA